MNLEILKSNSRLIQDVRSNLGLDSHDTNKDESLCRMTKEEIFNRYLTWNGIIGYSSKIYSAYSALKNASQNGNVDHSQLAKTDIGNEIIECLRKRWDYPDFDSSEFDEIKFDAAINQLYFSEAFNEYLEWNGFLGFGSSLISIIETLEQASE